MNRFGIIELNNNTEDSTIKSNFKTIQNRLNSVTETLKKYWFYTSTIEPHQREMITFFLAVVSVSRWSECMWHQDRRTNSEQNSEHCVVIVFWYFTTFVSIYLNRSEFVLLHGGHVQKKKTRAIFAKLPRLISTKTK